jgi:hypothetical protein
MLRAKNEARFLPELIGYHVLLGVEHFYVYDNNSTDQLGDALAPLVARGLVTIVPWPNVPASPSCYRHFFDQFAASSQWVAFIDADEFIVESRPGTLLATLQQRQHDAALALNWRYFGSSFHERVPVGLLIENFRMANRGFDRHIKVIAQPQHIRRHYNSHNFIYSFGRFARALDRKIVAGSRLRSLREGPDISINHYVYRSRENYLAKTGYGFVDREGFQARGRRVEYVDTEFGNHNDVEVSDLGDRMGPAVAGFLRTCGYGEPYLSKTPEMGTAVE